MTKAAEFALTPGAVPSLAPFFQDSRQAKPESNG